MMLLADGRVSHTGGVLGVLGVLGDFVGDVAGDLGDDGGDLHRLLLT